MFDVRNQIHAAIALGLGHLNACALELAHKPVPPSQFDQLAIDSFSPLGFIHLLIGSPIVGGPGTICDVVNRTFRENRPTLQAILKQRAAATWLLRYVRLLAA
jgi:hypothetical protein